MVMVLDLQQIILGILGIQRALACVRMFLEEEHQQLDRSYEQLGV